MWKNESMRTGVIASVIASIIFLIINPLLNAMWVVILNGSNWMYKSYVNTIYENASLGTRNWIDVVIYSIILIAIAFLATYYGLKLIIQGKEISKEIQKIEENLNGIPEKDKSVSKEQIIDKIEKLKTSNNRSKMLHIPIYLLLVIEVIVGISSYFAAYTDLQLNSTFQQRIRLLAPYIDEQKEEYFIALWTSMKTREDYEVIMNEFNTIARTEKIKLPEPLMK